LKCPDRRFVVHDDPHARETLSFGPFEWDPARGVLRRSGVRLRLGGQPLEILTILLEHADRLVMRDELRRRLWGQNTFVDFEQGLNTAIARLRHSLGDSAERPHFIETVPGRGYRFIAPVTRGDPATPDAEPLPRAGIDRRTWLAGGLGLALGAVGMYAAKPWRRPPTRTAGPRRFVLSGGADPELELSNGFRDLAISPDGRRIVYRTSVDGAARFYTRSLDRLDGRLLPEGDVFNPFFSPDGTEVGYYRFVEHQILRASVLGGPASRVADVAAFVAGASWSADGTIVFGTLDAAEGLLRVPAGGGRIESLTAPEPGVNHVLPEVLPGDLSVLFTIAPIESPRTAQIAVLDLDTGEHRTLLTGSHPHYVPTGHLLYVLDDDLMAVPFDGRRRRIEGAPVAMIEGLATATGTLVPTGQYSLSRDGSLLVALGTGTAERELVWVDRDGSEQALPAPPRGYTYPRISPDGRRIALNVRDAKGGEIELWDVARGDSTPVTGSGGLSLYPVWTPGGANLVYGAGTPLEHGLYRKAVERSGPGQRLDTVIGSELRALYFVSPDGDELVFARQGRDGAELMLASLAERREPRLLLHRARNADLSPDGRRVAYQSDESGQFEIYVRSFPDVEGYYTKVSSRGGIQPVWSPRGDELFFIEPGPPSRLMSAAVTAGSGYALARPRALLDWPYYTGELGRTYDVSRPDGARFLAVKAAAPNGEPTSERPRVEIVLGWLDELEARVPRGAA
jgi:eukaryotic-like serine/threonine-protein kinase